MLAADAVHTFREQKNEKMLAQTLDTLALVCFKQGDVAKALELQKEALALAQKNKLNPQILKDVEKRLEMYNKKMKK